MGFYLLHELREVLRDNSEGSATHSKVIALFLLTLAIVMCPVLQVDVHNLEEKGSVVTRMLENGQTVSSHSFIH